MRFNNKGPSARWSDEPTDPQIAGNDSASAASPRRAEQAGSLAALASRESQQLLPIEAAPYDSLDDIRKSVAEGVRAVAYATATALGRPQRAGRNEWRCVCPLHGGHSLELADGSSSLLVKCWAGCDTTDVLAYLRARGLLDAKRQQHQRVDRDDRRSNADPDDAARTARALALWREAVPIVGTLAARYLAIRSIVELPPEVNEVLRFHPNCIFG
jgi:hypothetical protein